jgi:hypothetical protein
MRAVSFIGGTDLASLAQKVQELCNASQEVTEEVTDAFTIVGTFTPTRTLNMSTATLADLRNVVATFLSDMQKRGTQRFV